MPEKDFCQNIWWTGFESQRVQSHANDVATYERDMSCDVTIKVRGDVGNAGLNYGIHIIFLYMDIEMPDNGTCLDYLQFFYDYERSRPITPQMCGDTLPNDIHVPEDAFTMYFFSDSTFEAGGFRYNFTQYVLPGQTTTTTFSPVSSAVVSAPLFSSVIMLTVCVMSVYRMTNL